jgi:hypothetical protein
MGQVKALRGADLQVYINGSLFGICTGLRWQSGKGNRAIYGIDQTEPFEIAPGQTYIRGAIESIRLRRDGGYEGRGIIAPHRQVLLEKYFALAVVDRSTDTVLMAIDRVSADNQSWSVSAKQEVSGSFSFEGIGYTSEAEQ